MNTPGAVEAMDHVGATGGYGPEAASPPHTQATGCWTKFRKIYLLPSLFLVAMVVGVSMGLLIREVDPEMTSDKRRLMYLKFPGEIMMNMLKMMILPLIVSSLVSGMASLPSRAAGKLGMRTVAYYLTTTFVAVLIGIVLVVTIQPGSKGDRITVGQDKHKLVEPADAFLDLIRNAFPPNLVQACFSQLSTNYITEDYTEDSAEFNNTLNTTVIVPETKTRIVDFEIGMNSNMNVLGMVVFSVALGMMIGRLGDRGHVLRMFFETFQEVIIKIVKLIIWYSPIGITFLLASQIVSMEDPAQSFLQLGWYMLTVITGLFVHGFVVLPLLYLVIARKNPFTFIGKVSPALMLALSTASSSATLPMTLRCLTRAGVSPLISGFMLPVGATINMDGTALYEAVATIFIAQYEGIELSLGQIITVSFTATAAAIGAAGVPEAGLVTLVIALSSVGLPTDDIGLIYAVDWILDRCRTMVNVWGDSVGAGIVDATSQSDLLELEGSDSNLPPEYTDKGGLPYVIDTIPPLEDKYYNDIESTSKL